VSFLLAFEDLCIKKNIIVKSDFAECEKLVSYKSIPEENNMNLENLAQMLPNNFEIRIPKSEEEWQKLQNETLVMLKNQFQAKSNQVPFEKRFKSAIDRSIKHNLNYN
jgi:hypothetical protein